MDHWRSISRDNVTTVYGVDGGSRIFDPHDPTRVFSWLVCLSYDGTGEAVGYEYHAEDGAGVDLTQAHERHRAPLDRTGVHLAGVATVGGRHGSCVRGIGQRVRDRGGLASRSIDRPRR